MIRKERLSNGLTLITESIPQVRSVAVGVWLRKGSRDEPLRLNGASHLLEHMVFKGTETRSAREIALVMDSIGGQLDAFTSKEYTCFYARVLDEHVPTALDLLSDIVLHPKLDREDLERERKVVAEEIRMVEDTPEELVYDLFAERFYPGSSLGRPIQGTERTVRSLTRRSLIGFFHGVYRPQNMLIVAAGHFRHERLSKMVRSAFGKLPREGWRRTVAGTPRPRPGVVLKSKQELEQLHLVLGLPGFAESFPNRYPLFVLNALLGGTMSSRLFQKIREDRGLAYAVYSSLNAFRDTGVFMIYAATSPRKGNEVIGLILDELREIRRTGPERAETEVAKEHLKGSLILSLESTVSRMSNLARHEMYHGRHLSPAEMIRGVESVTSEQVRRMARRLFQEGRVALAAVGRTGHLRLSGEALSL